MAKKTIEQIDASLSRWQSRLKRAVNAIERLQKARKRLAKAKPVMTKAEAAAEPVLRAVAGMPAPTGAKLVEIDTSIPTFLDRTKPNPADAEAAAKIREEQADAKRRKAQGRAARKAADKSGERKKMPLTGRAALAAIRGDTGANGV